MIRLRLSRTTRTILQVLVVQAGLMAATCLMIWTLQNRPLGHWSDVPILLGTALLVLLGFTLNVLLGIRWRRSADEGLREVRGRFKHLVESIDGIVWESDAQTLAQRYINPQAERMLGYPLDNWYADPHFWRKHLHPEDREKTIAFFQAAEASLKPFTAEYRMIRSDGCTVWIRDIVSVQEENGKPAVIRGIMMDFTDRKRVQEDLEHALEALRTREMDLTRYKDHLEELVVERSQALIRANTELKVAWEKAEESNRLKSHFLANMSHELRTPLNAIILYSELIIEQAKAEEQSETVEDLHKIQNAGRHLLALIDDILDLSKLDAGRIRLNLEEVDLPDMIHELAVNMTPMIARNGNRIDLTLDPQLPRLWTDPTRLRQILIKLLENACKFTSGGTLTLGTLPAGQTGDTVIFVRDTGIGMTEEEQSRIFQRFSQGDASPTRRFGGTGLGLTLSQGLTDLLGGTLWVESRIGEGSTFFLRLPHHPMGCGSPAWVPAGAPDPQP